MKARFSMCSHKSILHLPILSNKQRQVLIFIINYLKKFNDYPLYSEIDKYCKTGGSPSQILRRLEEKGYIERSNGKWRGLRLSDLAFSYFEKDYLHIKKT